MLLNVRRCFTQVLNLERFKHFSSYRRDDFAVLIGFKLKLELSSILQMLQAFAVISVVGLLFGQKGQSGFFCQISGDKCRLLANKTSFEVCETIKWYTDNALIQSIIYFEMLEVLERDLEGEVFAANGITFTDSDKGLS